MFTVKMVVFGRLFDVEVSAEEAMKLENGRRDWNVYLSKMHDAAVSAIAALQSSSGSRRSKALRRAKDAVEPCSSAVSSEKRLTTILRLTLNAPADLFWPIMLDNWPGCDATWPLQRELLSALGSRLASAGRPEPYYSDEARVFLDSLGSEIKVYRGCSRERVLVSPGPRMSPWPKSSLGASGHFGS
jgi:hypothetical protein